MSLNIPGFLVLAGLPFLLSSCMHYVQQDEAYIIVDAETEEAMGWFSASGEWTIFPGADLDSYDPYTSDDKRRCVSLVNDTQRSRDAFADLDGRRVTVSGVSIRYDDLPVGESAVNRFLEQKYYNDEIVFNFCLRDYVFIVRSIEPA